MIPRTGSLGLTRDMWILARTSCFEVDPETGHSWTPPQQLAERLAATPEAFEAGFLRDPEVCDHVVTTVPFDPNCKKCRQVGKRMLEKRGLTREQVKRCFEAIGAKWEWTSRESDRKRRLDDSGEMVVDQDGKIVTDRTIKARQRRRARKIAEQDAKHREDQLTVTQATKEAQKRLQEWEKTVWGVKDND